MADEDLNKQCSKLQAICQELSVKNKHLERALSASPSSLRKLVASLSRSNAQLEEFVRDALDRIEVPVNSMLEFVQRENKNLKQQNQRLRSANAELRCRLEQWEQRWEQRSEVEVQKTRRVG